MSASFKGDVRVVSRGPVWGLMPQTVFWPEDIRASGICYGWKKPALCVAGVIHENSVGSRPGLFRVNQFCLATGSSNCVSFALRHFPMAPALGSLRRGPSHTWYMHI